MSVDLIQNLAIFRCTPQGDPADRELLEIIKGDDIESYSATNQIVSKFTGKLETRKYKLPSRKNAREHDFENMDIQTKMNEIATFGSTESGSSVEDEEKEADEETEADEEDTFLDVTRPIVDEYLQADNSVNCILLLIEYQNDNERFESENRVMIVQMPFIEGTYQPSDNQTGDELFNEIQEAFDDTLKKSVLYPCQEVSNSDSDSDSDSDEEPILGSAFLYQGNGQANYWHEFLGLRDELHEDELLLEGRMEIQRKSIKEDEEVDDPFSEIESVEDLSQEELPDEVEDRRESGIVVRLGGSIEIHGLTVGQLIDQDPIALYEDDNGESYVVIRGHEPMVHPVGKSSQRVNTKGDDTEPEKIDIPVFPNLTSYEDISDLS